MWLKSIRKRLKQRLSGKKTLQQLYPEYQFGRGTYGAPLIRRWERNGFLKIGAFCSIAPNVQIFLGGEHRIDWVTTYPFNALEESTAGNAQATKGDVVIGNDVWIGDGVTILSGVKIGDGAVIGARALVTKDVLPYTINGGNPSRCIRKRFDDRTIADLLSIQWWQFTDEQIAYLHPFMASTDIAEFIRQAQQFLPEVQRSAAA